MNILMNLSAEKHSAGPLRKALIAAVFAGLLAASAAFPSEVTKMGTSAAQFLKIGAGSRAAAMGDASVAEANDASAIYWNPAGLAAMTGNQLIFSRTNWIADMNYDLVVAAFPNPRLGTFALYYFGLSMDEMEVRTEYDPEGTGEMFNAASYAMGISYARNMTDRFSFGINAKYITETIWHEKASTVAFDIGINYLTVVKNLKLGMVVSNYGGKMRLQGNDLLSWIDIDPTLDGNNTNIIANLNTLSYDLPLSFKIGFSYKPIVNELMTLTLAADAVSPNDYMEYINAGAELALYDMAYLRMGYKGIGVSDDEVGYTYGAGLKYPLQGGTDMGVDFALVDFGRLSTVKMFSLFLNF